jgi:hypothetical protein
VMGKDCQMEGLIHAKGNYFTHEGGRCIDGDLGKIR